jgi:hypothetical protein
VSAAPISPEEVPQVVKDGLVAAVLGSLAMAGRLLLSETPVSAGWVIRRILAAAITALFVGFYAQENIASVPLRYAVVGAAGYSAPECLDALLRFIKKRAEVEVGKAAEKVGIKKPNAKRGAKKKR